ncbi:Mitochondrial intermediate peptidase [Apophysomyces ossiformis]|uniref:mitochondrial intermediate peptidase n=1 Tax=Apophysomyces ossiformis TaxID=679940 RepID=A0A8H7BZ41_9FUNG|nr:Mitochondrial intermediate peptidase [Apophysomyces ossiformis]
MLMQVLKAVSNSNLYRSSIRSKFSGASLRLSHRLVSTVNSHTSLSPCGSGQDQDNDYLRLLFDDKDIWQQHREAAFLSTPTKSSFYNTNRSNKIGLFQNSNFVDAQGFDYATKQAIQRAQLIVERICKAPENGPAEMRKVVKNLDRLSDTLCSVIDMAELIRNAHPDEKIMEAANKTYSDLCSYMNTLNTDVRIHQVSNYLRNQLQTIFTITEPQVLAQVLADKSIVQKFAADEHTAAIVFMRDFEKSGIHLPEQQRAKFVGLSDRIILLGREFIQRDPRAIDNVKVPKSLLKAIGHNTSGSGRVNADYTLVPTDSSTCQLLLKYSPNEQVRKQIYEAVNSANKESILILEQLMKTRAELARLVGKSSFAELQLQDKMAKNPQNVDAFLQTLLRHQQPAAEKDLLKLRETMMRAEQLDSLPVVDAWNRDYYMQMHNASDASSNRMAAPYFSIGSVIQGLSTLFKHLYGVQFEAAHLLPGESWHEDVRKLNVICEREGKIGTIYCDLFDRPGKTTNAAHYTVRTSRRVDDDDEANDVRYAFSGEDVSAADFLPPTVQSAEPIRGREGRFQLPVIALTCDFVNRGNNRCLLSMFEVETLFHEMGHAMHSMLGRTDFHNVAGTRCATDFVELPSILMEHFVWHPDVLPLFCRDYITNQKLSPESIQAYLQQKRRFSAIEVNSQILMALLDQQYHSIKAMYPAFSSAEIWYSIQDRFGLFRSVPGTMWPVQFGHLFGYGAGYYSYLFDRTLARRVWEKCFQKNPLDREKGLAFRDNLLKWGGARDPWKCVAEVLGGHDGERIAEGDENAMRVVGDWGIDV